MFMGYCLLWKNGCQDFASFIPANKQQQASEQAKTGYHISANRQSAQGEALRSRGKKVGEGTFY